MDDVFDLSDDSVLDDTNETYEPEQPNHVVRYSKKVN